MFRRAAREPRIIIGVLLVVGAVAAGLFEVAADLRMLAIESAHTKGTLFDLDRVRGAASG